MVVALGVLAALLVGVPTWTGAAGATDAPGAFVVDGDVRHPLLLDGADLRQRPSQTVTAGFVSGSGPETHTWVGVPLLDVLEEAEPVLLAVFKNPELRLTVTVTASDGYRVALAYGELDPGFGAQPALLAYEQDGEPLDRSAAAGPRLVLPGDERGGRYVSGITAITVGTAWPEDPSWVPHGGVMLYGEVGEPQFLSIADLAAMPSRSVDVTFQSGTSTQAHRFTGVPLLELLDGAGLEAPDAKNGRLQVVVTATGADGYQAVVSVGEVDPNFGGVDVLVAFEQDGTPLDLPRLVVPGDVRGDRYVSDVTNLVAALTHTSTGAPLTAVATPAAA